MNIGFNGELVPHTGSRAANVTAQRVDPSMLADIAKAQPNYGSLWKDIANFGKAVFQMSEQMQEADFRVDTMKMQEDYQHQLSSLSQDMTARQLNGEFDNPTEYFNAYEKGLTQIRTNVTNAAYGTADGSVKGYFRNKDINKPRYDRMIESLQENSWRQGMAQYEAASVQYRNNQLDGMYKLAEQVGGQRGAAMIAETVKADWRVANEQKTFVTTVKAIPLIASEAWDGVSKTYDEAMSTQSAQRIDNIYATEEDADNKVAGVKAENKAKIETQFSEIRKNFEKVRDKLVNSLPENASQEQKDAVAALANSQYEKLEKLKRNADDALEKWFGRRETDASAADLKQFVDLQKGLIPDGTLLRPKTQKLSDLTDLRKRENEAKIAAEKAAKQAEAAEDEAQLRRYLMAKARGEKFDEELRQNVAGKVEALEFKEELASIEKAQAKKAEEQWYRWLFARLDNAEFTEDLIPEVAEKVEDFKRQEELTKKTTEKKLEEQKKQAEAQAEASRKAYLVSPEGKEMTATARAVNYKLKSGGLLQTKEGKIPVILGAEKYYADCTTVTSITERTEALLMLKVWGIAENGKKTGTTSQDYLAIIEEADRLLPDEAATRVASAVKSRLVGTSGKLTDQQLTQATEEMKEDIYRKVMGKDKDDKVSASDIREWLKTPTGRIAARTVIDFRARAAHAGSEQEMRSLQKEVVDMAVNAIEDEKNREHRVQLINSVLEGDADLSGSVFAVDENALLAGENARLAEKESLRKRDKEFEAYLESAAGKKAVSDLYVSYRKKDPLVSMPHLYRELKQDWINRQDPEWVAKEEAKKKTAQENAEKREAAAKKKAEEAKKKAEEAKKKAEEAKKAEDAAAEKRVKNTVGALFGNMQGAQNTEDAEEETRQKKRRRKKTKKDKE